MNRFLSGLWKKIREVVAEYPRPIFFLGIFLASLAALIYFQFQLHETRASAAPGQANLLELVMHALTTILVVSALHLLDQVGLWREVFRRNKQTLNDLWKGHSQIVESAEVCGITKIYRRRHDARKDFYDAIKKAEDRIWLLGVGLNVTLDLESLNALLKRKKAQPSKGDPGRGVDVRVLMLDPVRSTAVFRTLLECEPDDADNIIQFYTSPDPQPAWKNVYFNQRLYRRLDSTCKSLEVIRELQESVRFYAHTPVCWMVVADETAYFQPYTFGAGPEPLTPADARDSSPLETTEADKDTLGDHLPVFKFQNNVGVVPFKVLEDHFKKLWATSDTDLFHLKARLNAAETLVKTIFDQRGAWLRQVHNVLHPKGDRTPGDQPPDAEDYRRFPRQQCPSDISVRLQILGGDAAGDISAKIRDFSRGGLALEELGGDGVTAGAKVRVESSNKELSEVAEFFKRTLLPPGNEYVVVKAEAGILRLRKADDRETPRA